MTDLNSDPYFRGVCFCDFNAKPRSLNEDKIFQLWFAALDDLSKIKSERCKSGMGDDNIPEMMAKKSFGQTPDFNFRK